MTSRALFLSIALGLAAAPAHAVVIDFDDPGLVDGSDITNFYAGLGVTFEGISNPFPIGPGPFPVPATVPTAIGGASAWDPGGLTAPGESPPNFAVGEGQGDPGDAGILMTFSFDISTLTLTGLDFGDTPTDNEEMTLAAYDAAGNLIGSQHFTTQFAPAAIQGTISFAGTRFVTFNYTNTQFGFYGIDDLSFEPAQTTSVPTPGVLPLFAIGLVALGSLRRRSR